jgi:CheY-like chemotaxis protein
MPRKSGIRFFYELRHNREWSKIPVVIVTAHARDERVEKDIQDLFAERTMTGPRTYLEKPIKPAGYVNLVKQELGISTEEEVDAAAQEIDRMRAKALELLNQTSPEKLKKALELLGEKE